MSVYIKIENDLSHPNHPDYGNYEYQVRVKGQLVCAGKVEDHSRAQHVILLLEKVVEDAKAKFHEHRVMI